MKNSTSEKTLRDQEVGQRLKQARLRAGYKTFPQAGKATNFHKQNVRDQEAGSRGVSPPIAEQYGRVYGADPWWILMGKSGTEAAALGKAHQIPENASVDAIESLIESFAKIVIQNKQLNGTPIRPLAIEVKNNLKTDADDDESPADRANRIRRSIARAIEGAATTRTSIPDSQTARTERAVELFLSILPLADY